MKRVLILCTGNSCRSQMAEAIWRARSDEWESFSAGTEPAEEVHPQAIAALENAGVPTDGLRPKLASEFGDQPFDLVVTVCDSASQSCPTYPGARELVHWSFEDPAGFEGTPEEITAGFRRVRDEITRAIDVYLQSDGGRFREWMSRVVSELEVSSDDRNRYQHLVTVCAGLIDQEPATIWKRLTAEIRDNFQARGWEWNGIYFRVDESTLRLAASAGPPVCAELRLRGLVGTSGMCFDGILMNQSLVTNDVGSWPGYVSCDGHSGLATVAGMVCPIRSTSGAPIAVWDLDSTAPLTVSDSVFFDRLFATLSATAGLAEALVSGNRGGDAKDETIRLDQFLKLSGIVATGGQAKLAIQGGEVTVNEAVETRRGRRLRIGDVVEFAGETLEVASD